MRRKKSQKNKKAGTIITIKSEAVENKRPVVMQGFYSLKAAFYSPCKTFKQPIILRLKVLYSPFFVSIDNLGSTMGSFVGAGLAFLLDVSSGSFDNLLRGIVIQVICTFIPVMFLFLIPKEATDLAA